MTDLMMLDDRMILAQALASLRGEHLIGSRAVERFGHVIRFIERCPGENGMFWDSLSHNDCIALGACIVEVRELAALAETLVVLQLPVAIKRGNQGDGRS